MRDRAWRAHGFARPDDHARERFGRSGRWLRNLAALGGALESMPRLAASLTGEDGGRPLGCVAGLLVARVATPASLPAWIALARSTPVRDLREAVARARAAGSAFPLPDEGGAVPPDGAPGAPPPEPDPAGGPADRDLPESDLPDCDLPDRELVRLLVPRPVAEAFDETLDLFRAVEGRETGATSFIEALVAEASAGDPPPDADSVPLRPGPDPALRERALAAATSGWRHLPRAEHSFSWAPAHDTLASLQALAREAGAGDEAALDRQIRSLLALEDGLQVELGRLLAGMGERGEWSRLGFAGVGHYAEERLRMSRTAAEDRARAARALRSYPLLLRAYEDGRLGLEGILTVLGILGPGPVSPEVERAWLARAEEATIKRLRDERRLLGRPRSDVRRGAHLGSGADRPGLADPPGPADRPGPADQPGLPGRSRPADRPGLADQPGHAGPLPPGDAEWHASLSRPPGRSRTRVLRLGMEAALDAGADECPGPGDRGGSAVCGGPGDRGGSGTCAGPGRSPSPDVFLRFRLPRDLAASFLGAVESRRRALASLAEEVPRDQPWPDPVVLPSLLAARTFSIRSHRVPAWTGLLALLEEFVLCWDGPARGVRSPGAPSPGVRSPGAPSPGAGPPPLRGPDAIYIRDGWRCTAPGCTSRRNLEDHHLRYRSRGGDDAPENRACLCRFHHQCGEHGGLASCRGTAPLGITWRLGRPEVGTWYRNERRLPADRATRSG
ncbi:MAG: HNH endonuclease signature motif containing protein [Candidatus Polarisedimenticolia bacterium]